VARLYCQITGVVLLIVGVLGIFWQGVSGFLSVNEPAEIGLHLVLGALSTYAGFSGGGYGRLALLYARLFGIVYLLLGVGGLLRPDLVPGVVHLDLGCNILHLILGLWGIWAGYLAGQPGAAAPAH